MHVIKYAIGMFVVIAVIFLAGYKMQDNARAGNFDMPDQQHCALTNKRPDVYLCQFRAAQCFIIWVSTTGVAINCMERK